MKTKDRKPKKAKPGQAGVLTLTAPGELPRGAVRAGTQAGTYAYRYTTGPFSLPPNAGSLDWVVLNNETTVQTVRVTIFKCSLVSTKTALPPGPLEITLKPGETTHNANKYGAGFVYEVQVECNSQLICPYVSVWPGSFGVTIPGTGIHSGDFIRRLS